MNPIDAMAWFFTLNVVDILATLFVLKQGGRELNPTLAKWFLEDDPDVVLVRIKAFLLSVVWVTLYFGLPTWALVGLVIGYFGLAFWNLKQVLEILNKE